MLQKMELYISLFAVLVSTSLFSRFLLPIIQRICIQKKLFDSTNERKVHSGIVPRLGGVSFLPALILATFLVLSVNLFFSSSVTSSISLPSLMEWMLVFSATLLLYLVGIEDDLVSVRYRRKLFIQAIAAILFIASGVWIDNLHGLFGLYEISPVAGIPLTFLVIVFIINAINFIDGIDGLAAGIGMLGFLFFGFTFLYLDLYIYSIMSFSALGMLIPFFYFNIFGKVCNQNKIFMGDCGSLTIGMLLAVFATKVYQSASANPDYSPQALALGFAVLIVPMFDALRVILLRLLKGKNPFQSDRSHIHHQLLDLGLSHRAATLVLLTNAIFFGAITVLLIPNLDNTLLLCFIIVIWTLFDFFLRYRVKRVTRSKTLLQNKDYGAGRDQKKRRLFTETVKILFSFLK